MTPLNVLMVTSQFLPEVFGGAEQQCLKLSRVLAGRGHAVTVLTSRSAQETPAEELMGGVRIVRLFVPRPPRTGLASLRASRDWIGQALDWVAANRGAADVVHMHQAKMNGVVGAECTRRWGIPSVAKLGNAGRAMDLRALARARPFYGAVLARHVKRHATRFVAISSTIAEEMAVDGIDAARIARIPNGVVVPPPPDPAARARLRAELSLTGDQTAYLFAGRLERQKNVPLLLDGFKAFAEADPGAVLLLAGDGEDEAALRRQGAHDRIRFLGRRGDVGALMQAADVFVLPALTEGLSNALLEAMSHGLVPLSSCVSGSIDVIEDGENGWLFDAHAASSLTEALRRVAATPPARRAEMAAAARAAIAEGYDIEVVASRYESLYAALVAARHATCETGACATSPGRTNQT